MSERFHFDKYVPDDGLIGAKILFVGEAPGEHEHEEGKPFVGESGKILINCLSRAGLDRSNVRLANLCHFRPFNNKFELLLNSDVLKDGLRELYAYIDLYRPNVICPLGAWPLSFITGKKGIKKWRGSILSYINDDAVKVIPTIHPAAVFRDRTLYPIFDHDIKRVASDAAFPERNLPVRKFVCDPRGLELEEWTQKLCEAEFLGTDIETVKKSRKILCVGFAPSPEVAVCIVPTHPEGRRAIERILESAAEKIFQFGFFDYAQLRENGYNIKRSRIGKSERPYGWDTYVAQHILAPELPRSLEFLTSIYTREPYYKTVGRGSIPDDSKSWSEKVDKQTLYEYNCKDCCVTIEIALQQMQEIRDEYPSTQDIFDFEMSMIEVCDHISASGMFIDEERREIMERILLAKWEKKQFILDRMTGFETNVRSPKLKEILYDKLKLPTRRNRDGTITTDEDAIVSLITFCKDKIDNLTRRDAIIEWQIKLAVCQTILEIRGIRQNLSNYIRARQKDGTPRTGPDGRVRSTYKIGPETGRWASTKYVDGTGFNAQTLPRDPIECTDEMYSEVIAAVKESQLTMEKFNTILKQLEDDPDEDDIESEEAA